MLKYIVIYRVCLFLYLKRIISLAVFHMPLNQFRIPIIMAYTMPLPSSLPQDRVVLTADTAIGKTVWERHSAGFPARGLRLRHADIASLSANEQNKLLADARFLVVDCLRVDSEILNAARNCVAIIRVGDGYDNIDMDYATRHGIICCNQPGIWSYETAEYAFILGLMQLRRIPQLLNAHLHPEVPRNFRQLIDEHGPINNARGITVGIIGFGRIGREVTRLYGRIVKQIYITDTHATPAQLRRFARREHLRATLRHAPLDATLAASDILSLHIPADDRNHHLLSEQQFAGMKSTAIVVNCARGAIIDGQALHSAVAERRLGGAMLDITVPDPLPADHPLHQLEHIHITPHFAWYSDDALERMCRSVCDTVIALALRKIPPCAINASLIARDRMRLRSQ